VRVNGELVYSKHQTRKFPELGDLKTAVRKYLD
jgi:predicted Rdx family selenoprotein